MQNLSPFKYETDFIKNLMKGPDVRIPAALLIQQAREKLGSDANPEAETVTNPETEGNSTSE